MGKQEINTVDEYIAGFPENIQILLEQIRTVIKQTAPAATESISWEMPAYKLNGKPLVYLQDIRNMSVFTPSLQVLKRLKMN